MEKLDIYEIPKDIVLIKNVDLVMHDMKYVYGYCLETYHNHPYGCPNFNNKEGCPPNILHISQQYDLSSIHMLLLKFPFGQYIDEKRKYHPNWSNRALINQRHWQGHLKGQIKEYWNDIKDEYPGYNLILNPEGQGVNIEKTLGQYDIDLEWCKELEDGKITDIPEYIHHVALVGKELG